MSMKEVYKALEGLEGGEKLVELVKASETERGDFEKENRTLVANAEQYADLDIAQLKTMSEFVETNGGVEGVQGLIAKAEGFDTNEEKIKTQKAEYDALVTKHGEEAESFGARIAESNLRTELIPQFADTFNGSNVLLDRAILSGLVGKNESGLYYKSGDDVTSFGAGGFDKLKEHPDFAFALKTPSGGNEGAGSGAGGNASNNDDTPYWQ
jgi:hypothetical protein